jgi:serine/threonine protein kinase
MRLYSHAHEPLQSNIFVDDNAQPCLADFGLAVVSDVTGGHVTTSSTTAGSIRWTSPERITAYVSADVIPRRTYADDVWAFGCTCIEVYLTTFTDLMPCLIHGREIFTR